MPLSLGANSQSTFRVEGTCFHPYYCGSPSTNPDSGSLIGVRSRSFYTTQPYGPGDYAVFRSNAGFIIPPYAPVIDAQLQLSVNPITNFFGGEIPVLRTALAPAPNYFLDNPSNWVSICQFKTPGVMTPTPVFFTIDLPFDILSQLDNAYGSVGKFVYFSFFTDMEAAAIPADLNTAGVVIWNGYSLNPWATNLILTLKQTIGVSDSFPFSDGVATHVKQFEQIADNLPLGDAVADTEKYHGTATETPSMSDSVSAKLVVKINDIMDMTGTASNAAPPQGASGSMKLRLPPRNVNLRLGD